MLCDCTADAESFLESIGILGGLPTTPWIPQGYDASHLRLTPDGSIVYATDEEVCALADGQEGMPASLLV